MYRATTKNASDTRAMYISYDVRVDYSNFEQISSFSHETISSNITVEYLFAAFRLSQSLACAHISLCNWERGMNLVSEWQMMYRRTGICISSTIRSLRISTIEDVWLYTSRSPRMLGRELEIAMSIIYERLISAITSRYFCRDRRLLPRYSRLVLLISKSIFSSDNRTTRQS